MDYKQRYEAWLNSSVISDDVKDELRSLDEKEIEDRFYKELEFGTAGLRGIIGNGSNRMNIYTVGKATQGLANYIKSKNLQEKGVVISYDSRHKSKEFAQKSANILASNGIKVYLFEQLRPVPELSFALREHNATAGIMITASHNPPEYNGFKVYWDDGAQISEPVDKQIMDCVNSISYEDINYENKNTDLIDIIKPDYDKVYLDTIKSYILNSDAIDYGKDNLKIVYTPFHGTGNTLVEPLLKQLGFKHLFVVPEQAKPDGNFPTVDYPNPEDDKAFTLALKYAKEKNSDIILANDPDADRLGVWAKDKQGEYKPLTGNQSALVIAQYRLEQSKQKQMLPENAMMVDSIVSSNLARAIAKKYNVKLYETLTGFKNICKIIKQKQDEKFVFGFEESYGCLIGDYARDKDGISAVMCLCEIASYLKLQDKTLFDFLEDMYKQYGYYMEKTISIVKYGSEGAKQIENIMQSLREKDIEKIGDKKVISFMDILNDKKVENGITSNTNLPKSNVLYYELEDDCFACIRPSGTEPKIRIYLGMKANSKDEAKHLLDNTVKSMEMLVNI